MSETGRTAKLELLQLRPKVLDCHWQKWEHFRFNSLKENNVTLKPVLVSVLASNTQLESISGVTNSDSRDTDLILRARSRALPGVARALLEI